MVKRKCTFRFMLILANGEARIISQDVRRRRNIITGNIIIKKANGSPFSNYNAKALGCDAVFRIKQ